MKYLFFVFSFVLVNICYSHLAYTQDDSLSPALPSTSNKVSVNIQKPSPQPQPLENDTTLQLSPEEREARLSDYYAKAFTALHNGEYPYAAVMFENYLKLNTDNPKIYQYLSQIYIHLKRFSDAAKILQKLVERDPSNFYNQYQLGVAYAKAGYTDEAIYTLEKAVDLRADPEAMFQLGLAYERVNKLTKARILYEHVIDYNPDHADAHFSLGLLALRKRDFSTALQHIHRALEIKPNNPVYLEYLNKTLQLRDEKPHKTEVK